MRRALMGYSWILADVDGRYEIQRRDEHCHSTYTDTDALILVADLAAHSHESTEAADALEALKLVNFQQTR